MLSRGGKNGPVLRECQKKKNEVEPMKVFFFVLPSTDSVKDSN